MRRNRDRHGHRPAGDKGPTYSAWGSMRQRCNNPNTAGYHRYGGRGIKVCKRWDHFANFLADMGERPPGTSIDRIDNDGNYTPSNCQWLDHRKNSAKTCKIKWLTYNGRTQSASAWCREFGLPKQTLYHRLWNDWPIAVALTTPIGKYKGRRLSFVIAATRPTLLVPA